MDCTAKEHNANVTHPDAHSFEVVIVGRGRMGTAFAKAMRDARAPCRLVPARKVAARERVARPPRHGVTLWILAVTDAAVSDTAASLVRRGWVVRGDVVVHLAGMLGPDVLAPVRSVGARVAAMHPLVAVATPRDPPPLRGGVVSFEGDRAALPVVRAWARALGIRVVPLTDVNRVRYHAAAALVATGAVALAQGAAELFRQAARGGMTPQAIGDCIRSLLVSVAHNVATVGPAGALASPLMRGDTETVQRHLEAMHPRARSLYIAALAQALATLEERKLIDAAVIARARNILDSWMTR